MPFRFESLDIWHMARAYAMKVYAVTAKFPRHEDYGLKSQMNRAVFHQPQHRRRGRQAQQ
jgi:four helix bundle protein